MISIQSQTFAQRLIEKGVPLGQWLGSAGWGVVFQHRDHPHRVIKVTQMLREAEAALWVRSKQRGFHEPAHPCLPVIYGWQQDVDRELKHPRNSHTNYWIIEREELSDFSLRAVLGVPAARSTRENLIWSRIVDAVFECIESATMMQHSDPDSLARVMIEQALGNIEVKAWEDVQTQTDAELAEKTGVIVQRVRREFGSQIRRLSEFAAWCVRNQKILGDMSHWNWGLRNNREVVVRDLGGFLDWKFRHGPFEGLGAWTPKVIKGGREGPVTRYKQDWREGKPLLPRTGFGLKYQDIPSSDPWAYGGGFVAAIHGLKMPEMYLGSEYGRGFAHGMRVRNGEEDMPPWVILQSDYPFRGSRGEGRGSSQRGRAPSHPPRVSGPRMSVRRVIRHFASKHTPAHSSGAVWTDGVTLYSYKQAIAQKDRRTVMEQIPERIVFMDTRKFSKTTSSHQRQAQYELEIVGWKIAYKELPSA